jgi:hypothetical protein
MRLPQKFAAGTALALLTGMMALAPMAQADTKPHRIHGTIDQVDASSLELTARDGSKMTFKLLPSTSVIGLAKTTTHDIQPGSYVGTAAMPQDDGTLQALEVHIFPPSMKGTGEGERPWDQGKNSTMTNGMVGDVVGNDGHSFTIQYDGKQSKVIVPDSAPVVMMEPGDRNMLTPGAKVIVFAAPDEAQTAARITVGENGITPPM